MNFFLEPCSNNERGFLPTNYRGKQSITNSGFSCKIWSNSVNKASRKYNESNFPNSDVGNHNFCRNPTNDPNGSWCLSTNPNNAEEYCECPKQPFNNRGLSQIYSMWRKPLQNSMFVEEVSSNFVIILIFATFSSQVWISVRRVKKPNRSRV